MTNNLVLTRLTKIFCCVMLLVLFGTVGYMYLEGWSATEGFFMTVITLSTVGYGETRELTEIGRMFTSVLIFLCLVSMTCWTATLTSFVVESDLRGSFLRRRTLKMIRKLNDHTIVCGSGQMAQAVIERLVRQKVEVVVVDEDTEQLEPLRNRFRKIFVIEGSPTNELTLAKANVLAFGHLLICRHCQPWPCDCSNCQRASHRMLVTSSK